MGIEVTYAVDGLGAPLLLVAADATADPTPPAKAPPSPEPSPALGSDRRRRDAVVDAARTLEDLSPAGVDSFVRRRWRGDRAITPEDVSSFATDARAQRVHDVVDALDHRIRSRVHGRAGSRVMHVAIPRGIATKSLAALQPDEARDVFARLRDRGWKTSEIRRYGIRRLDSKDRRLQSILGQD